MERGEGHNMDRVETSANENRYEYIYDEQKLSTRVG